MEPKLCPKCKVEMQRIHDSDDAYWYCEVCGKEVSDKDENKDYK